MMKLLTAAQMRLLDRTATETYLIPSLLLMENAALGACGILREAWPEAQQIAIICGPGQNGGDGYAMARHLSNEGVDVTIFRIEGGSVPGDASANLAIAEAMGLPVEVVDESFATRILVMDLIVDAMFGTGLTRPLEGTAAVVVDAINGSGVPVISLDLPSGIDASRGGVPGPAVRADLTVTFASAKLAHLVEPASSHCGEVVVVDIGIPPREIEQIDAASVIDADLVIETIPLRPADSHKGTWGHAAIIAGSPGRSGAAILAARGAIRGGAGLVTVFTDSETAGIVDTVSVESMSQTVDWDVPVEDIVSQLGRSNAVLIGPGLIDDETSWKRIRSLVERIELPLVADAGAINAFSGNPRGLRGSFPRILTPHPGELARLLGVESSYVSDHRLECARDAAGETGCIVVLKGSGTIVAAPDGRTAVSAAGSPALGTGGTGDVLGGVAVALLARRIETFRAACVAVWLHARAGELIAARLGDSGLTATELADTIPLALRSAREDE